MKKFITCFTVLMLAGGAANAQSLSKGAVQRLNLDSITLDGTTVTATGAELNILDGVTATTEELNNVADASANTEDTTATNALTASECGKNFYLNSATEFVTTLPAPTLGCGFKFYVDSAPVGANYTIVTSDGDETIKGIAFDMTGGAVSAGAGTAAADTITFVASTALEADFVELLSNGDTWHGVAYSSASGAITYTSAQ